MARRHQKLVQVNAPQLIDTRDLWLLMPRDLRRVARVRTVRDFLVALVREHGPVLSGVADAS